MNLRLAAMFMALAACPAPDARPTVEHVHTNGLTLRLPASLFVREVQDGFTVDVAASGVTRYSQAVTITRRAGTDRPVAWAERVVAGRACSYRHQQSSSGSGGDELTLDAWCPYPGGHVEIAQGSQAEWPATPDDSLAWQVMAALEAPR